MKIARVAGNVVSTFNHSFFDGQRLLLCDLLDAEGHEDGYLICVDVVGAGAGETVLICDEGTSARQMFGINSGPIRSVIVGIIDEQN